MPGANRFVLRFIKDPIHDLIEVSPRLSVFLDTRQFQRLRNIKQLGTSYYVWPGASHNRFEHCLGVAHLAKTLATNLQTKQPDFGISDRDIECVELAGLCHDLGHGPWSHVWDASFMPMALPKLKTPWKHEQGSEMMFDYLVTTNNIEIEEADTKFVKALIAGDPAKCDPSEKGFLFDIVANKRNGLDVDKFDYFVRDSHMIGEPIKINLTRLLKSARVIDGEICYDIKDANNIYEVYNTRFRLYKQIYNHKTAAAIEYMIVDALLLAEPYLQIATRVFDPAKFTYLTDDIMTQIEYEALSNPDLAPAAAIFDRIRTRELYKSVDYKTVDWADHKFFEGEITPAKIVREAHNDMTEPSGLTPDDVIVSFSPMHYGLLDENPLRHVKFYSKARPDVCAIAQPGDYSSLVPSVFGEVLLRVYTKKAEYYSDVQAGYRALLSKIAGRPSVTVRTPPATETSSTPGPSRNNGVAALDRSPGGSRYGENQFTTVERGYIPASPAKQLKREVGNSEAEGSSKKKRP
ncbi:HD-domain/PDEase-like protein [Guyanagaster necrorhizus]|uniref:HD-domain/PDEase-like protein n=1 Tax=Guyanagaster necrorhizus TaxID=856835 RepID=A0A9P7VJ64_9AGAR|nr:HD-domain/PDEase-like protein [Guyanagaster necrorhizus MCA 3950]KAG7441654.1 HD-domain/PDEase-like protein [Guyanagaster necrorhizus MCA 3950]